MTEYWVSQGNKWCDFCKIFLSNNPATIRNHELGQRHKDNVAKRLTDMRKDKADKDKKEKEAVKALEQIEAVDCSQSLQRSTQSSFWVIGNSLCVFNTGKAEKSYQKDKVSFQKAGQARAPCLGDTDGRDWEYDSSSGYYFDQQTGIHYDPNSGFYYSDILGKWVSQEEAFAAVQKSGGSKQNAPLKKPLATPANEKKETVKSQGSSTSFNPTNRSFKGAATSSVAVQKRKRPMDKKPKAASPEETAALKAREAARRRVEDREKSLLGLYQH